MPLFENHLGVQVSLDSLRLVEIVYKNDEFYLENVGEQKFDYEISPNIKDSDFIDVLQNAFINVIDDFNINSQFISFTLPSSFFQIFEVPFEDTLLTQDLHEHFDWELKKLYPSLINEEVAIQHIEYKGELGKKTKMAGVLAISKRHLKTLQYFAANNDLKLKYIDHPYIASNIFIKIQEKEAIKQLGATIFLADKVASINLLSDGSPFAIKRKSFEADEEVDVTLRKLLESLVSYDFDFSNLGYTYIFGNGLNDEIIDSLSDSFGFQIQPIAPFKKLKKEESLNISDDYLSTTKFTPAAAVALRLI